MRRSHTLLMTLGMAIVLGTLTAEAQGPGFRGREQFAVTAAEDAFVLVEQATGRTWLLAHSAGEEGRAVWLPIERLDSREEAADWRERNRTIGREREHQQRETAQQQRREVELHSHVREIQARLEELTRRHDELRKQYGNEHPQVRELTNHRERLERELVELKKRQRDRDEPQRRDREREEPERRARPDREREDREREDREPVERGEREREERDVIERRQQFQRRRSASDNEPNASAIRMLMQAQQELQKSLLRLRDQDSAPQDIRRVEILMETVGDKLDDVRGMPGEQATDEHREREGEARNIIERRQQFQQRRREHDESQADSQDSEGAAAVSRDLLMLLVKEQLLLETRGSDHPDVQAVRKQIEVTRDLQSSKTSKALLPLLVKRELLLENRGPDHPEVRALQKEIDVTRRLLEENPPSDVKADDR